MTEDEVVIMDSTESGYFNVEKYFKILKKIE